MITKETTIYKCDWCGKIYLSKGWCKKHEPNCKANPVNFQKCTDGCVFLENKEAKYTYQGISMGKDMAVVYEEKEGERDLLFCTKKKAFVYPFWCRKPILQEDIAGEIENNQMPKECDLFDNVAGEIQWINETIIKLRGMGKL